MLVLRGLLKDSDKFIGNISVLVVVSVMKGMKVLVRKDLDGFFYMVFVKE